MASRSSSKRADSSLSSKRQPKRVFALKLIKNKQKRKQVWAERKAEQAYEKQKAYTKRRKRRLKYGFQAAPFKIDTQETKRIPNETDMKGVDEVIEGDMAMDSLAPHFSGLVQPKICITSVRRPIPELLDVFPDAKYFPRRTFGIKEIVKQAVLKGFTSVVVIHQDTSPVTTFKGYCRGPHKLTHVALPYGPTAHYRLTSIRGRKQIFRGAKSTAHRPELILSNFQSRLGVQMGRMLGTMFDQRPEFRGRQVVTFRNQRDFLFFRRHRYMFVEQGKDCILQELGPRFTLKLIWMHKGLFDPRHADYLWKWNEDMGLEKLRFNN